MGIGEGHMLTVICVLKSGGPYDASWVEKLKRGVERNLSVPHKFVCLSDVPVPCHRIKAKHDWPAWWIKIELFRKGVITPPCLYIDLDTVITGPLDEFVDRPEDFSMLQNFHDPAVINSSLMWFRKVPHEVYDKFVQKPWQWIEYYQQFRRGNHVGDQAFIADTLRDINLIAHPRIRSYKKHCKEALPEGTAIVCFHGMPRPNEIKTEWMQRNWI